MEDLKSLSEFHLNNDLSADIRYADDTTLVSVIFDKLKLSSQELEKTCQKWGLKVNVSKCKVSSTERDINIEMYGEPVENVDHTSQKI